jgi:hypothetical protein
MFLQRQGRVEFEREDMEIPTRDLNEITQMTASSYGPIRHLGPVLRMSETPPRWQLPSAPLGSHEPVWLERS